MAFKKLKKYVWNVLFAIDQLFNALFGGDPDETISSRLGKAMVRRPKNSKLAHVICWFLDKIDPNHCKNAIEEDEGKDEILEI